MRNYFIMDRFRLAALELNQIGPFGKILLEFPDKPTGLEGKAEIQILTGENGSGKSTVLEMLAACLSKAGTHYSHRFRTNTPEQSVNLITSNGHFNIIQSSKDPVNNYKVGDTSLLDELFWKPYQNYPQARFGMAFFTYSGYRQVDLNGVISGIQEITEHPFAGVFDFRRANQDGLILQWIANTIAAEAIAIKQHETVEAEQRRNAIVQLAKAVGHVIGQELSFKLETRPFTVKTILGNEILDFEQLPDGVKSILSWMADLLMRMDRVKWMMDIPPLERNFILLLDEIEVHMHPAWQRRILPAVQTLFPNAQIFISTHSPFVVGSVDGAWIHKLVKSNGDSRLAEGFPICSEDAQSYRYWLSQAFDVHAEYGLETETDLLQFYMLRDKLLAGNNGITQESFLVHAQALADQSAEMRQIMEFELKQVNRRLNAQLTL